MYRLTPPTPTYPRVRGGLPKLPHPPQRVPCDSAPPRFLGSVIHAPAKVSNSRSIQSIASVS